MKACNIFKINTIRCCVIFIFIITLTAIIATNRLNKKHYDSNIISNSFYKINLLNDRTTNDNSNQINDKINQTENDIIQLSRILNDAMKQIGRLTCQLSKNGVSMNGGWCSKLSGRDSNQHVADVKLARELSRFLSGKTVASFGEGPGEYKEIILNLNQVKCYDAFDGAPYVEETTSNTVIFLDLSVPIYHLSPYDWVISLEVAEHIPQKYEIIFIDNLVRHAKEGVILSWASLNQTGHSHVNNRDFDYIKSLMESRRFRHDENLTNNLRNHCSLDWLSENINVFLKN